MTFNYNQPLPGNDELKAILQALDAKPYTNIPRMLMKLLIIKESEAKLLIYSSKRFTRQQKVALVNTLELNKNYSTEIDPEVALWKEPEYGIDELPDED